MITVAPATHTFGKIHTERNGQGTLFLANPTFADAEWSLSHIPEPPPKKRQTYIPGLAGTGVGVGRAPPAGMSGGVKLAASSGPPGVEGSPGKLRKGTRGGIVAGVNRSAGKTADSLTVDDPSVFVFSETGGVVTGVKLPLKSSAACLPEDWNRLEVRKVCPNRGLRRAPMGRAGSAFNSLRDGEGQLIEYCCVYQPRRYFFKATSLPPLSFLTL